MRCSLVCVQCAVQPHVGAVYADLLLQSRTSAEFYIKVGCMWSTLLLSALSHNGTFHRDEMPVMLF